MASFILLSVSMSYFAEPKGGHKPLELFANEVSLLIKNQPDKRLGLHNLSSEYYKYYGKQLKLAELGFSKLNDLVTAISDYVEVSIFYFVFLGMLGYNQFTSNFLYKDRDLMMCFGRVYSFRM